MRRPTITPATAPSARNSIKPRVSLSKSNMSVRRDPRNVRDKDWIQTCITSVEDFLIKHDYQFTQKTLTNPSAKDVSMLFRFIFSYHDSDYSYSSRFEDDVILILKGCKYPYMGEINKSQFIAITPHSWPAIISMLAWLVEIIDKEIILPTESFGSLYNKHLTKGYIGLMEGADDFDIEAIKSDIENQYKDVFIDIDKRIDLCKEIEGKIESLRLNPQTRNNNERKDKAMSRRNEIINDLEKLKLRSKQLTEKKKKYENLALDLAALNEQHENEKIVNSKEIEKLRKLVDDQQIKPKDLDDMAKDKNEIYCEMERLRPVKEKLIRELNNFEKIQNDSVEIVEKMIFDIRNISNGAVIYKTIKENDIYKFELISDQCEIEIDETLRKLMNQCDIMNENYVSLNCKKTENEEIRKNLCEEIKRLDALVLAKGKFYIEKKAMHNAEHKKMCEELSALEDELLKMNMESQHLVLIEEKKCQEKQIEFDKYKEQKNIDLKTIDEACIKLRNLLSNVYKSLETASEEF